jgi:hypothetical protein
MKDTKWELVVNDFLSVLIYDVAGMAWLLKITRPEAVDAGSRASDLSHALAQYTILRNIWFPSYTTCTSYPFLSYLSTSGLYVNSLTHRGLAYWRACCWIFGIEQLNRVELCFGPYTLRGLRGGLRNGRPGGEPLVSRLIFGLCLRAGRPWEQSSSPSSVKNFLFSTSTRPALRPTQPPTQWVLDFIPWVKRPGREADHSPPSSTKVKETWICISTTPYVFMA